MMLKRYFWLAYLLLVTVAAVMAADMMNGNDPDCARWLGRFREPAGANGSEGRRGRREGRRRRREGAAVSA